MGSEVLNKAFGDQTTSKIAKSIFENIKNV